MDTKIVRLTPEHLATLLPQAKLGIAATSLEQAYFSPGSIAYCLLADNEPVVAGGIVNGAWCRGEAWMLPTPFIRRFPKTSYKYMKYVLRIAALEGGFKRVQATCSIFTPVRLFEHLKFEYEGTLKCYGPNGETCHLYARFF